MTDALTTGRQCERQHGERQRAEWEIDVEDPAPRQMRREVAA
jgi:hypothetical protein